MTVHTPATAVRQAAKADHQVVLDVLTEAFMHDPLVRWFFPDPGPRGLLQRHFHRPLLTHPAAEVHLTGDNEGAAIWLALSAGQEPHAEEPESASVYGESGPRLAALGEALAVRHPVEPHLYLPCMGVIGGRQGAGLGSALLRHRLERADADGLATYLEAGSPRSRALYLRHGFQDLGEPVRVADSPLVQPMWRQPRP